jgi:hypothetical protein
VLDEPLFQQLGQEDGGDRGWGEDWRAGSDREKDGDADLERFRREKPPHW